jgi:hypothetical protein
MQVRRYRNARDISSIMLGLNTPPYTHTKKKNKSMNMICSLDLPGSEITFFYFTNFSRNWHISIKDASLPVKSEHIGAVKLPSVTYK